MAAHARSTFKRTADYYTRFPRPTSPEQPAIEPLSPSLRPQSTHDIRQAAPATFNGTRNPASLQQDAVGRDQSTLGALPHTHRHYSDGSRRRTPSTIGLPTGDALSASPTFASPSRREPRKGNMTDAPLKVLAASSSLATLPPPPYPAEARPAKRARSEAVLSPHAYHASFSRPATNHANNNVFAYNLEQSIDHARRQSSTSSNLEDAELLLNFATRVAPRAASFSSAVRPPTGPAPSLLPPPPPPPTAPTAVQPALDPSPDPSTSLPSPRETGEDGEKRQNIVDEMAGVEGAKPAQEQPANVEPVDEALAQNTQTQTQTPPEEDDQNRAEQDEASPAVPDESLEDVQHNLPNLAQEGTESEKAKPRRGWPKGKPRGPRNKPSGTTRPRHSTARSSRRATRGDAAESDSSAEDNGPTLPRRNSTSDITVPLGMLALVDERPFRAASVPPGFAYSPPITRKSIAGRKPLPKVTQDTVCAGCSQARESTHGELDQWISCNGCREWFHFDCAGFKSERDVRDVDKFFCKACEPEHGATTFVRKSTRAHTAVDYAGLNQGLLKTSDDCHEHHYIQPIKDGTFTFDPETFPRMRPELVTADFFERSTAFAEPILIPAEFNPRPQRPLQPVPEQPVMPSEHPRAVDKQTWMPQEYEYDTTFDDGQDGLDMVIPSDLTVRQVADLVGHDEPLEVIEVKEQGVGSEKWNLRKWANYYDAEGEKTIRNVISLEVSQSKLGKLLRRPKVVRQLDLQDNVWPQDEPAKSVAFYCLMSVADSYTDFHIDFGGSSVYYHILRGKKTFFFIPPKPKHLKAYEDWNNSHEQNFTFLPHITKECYRVDLSEGDTMLIPSGWIHAVWTPASSLVIGGNFLTHLHYTTQFRVADIEKANKTPLKFRYPKFQKVMWYSVIRYLDSDPLPQEVAESFYQGNKFFREHPIWQDFDEHGTGSAPGHSNYHSRYYSQSELDGLPDLVGFIFRTVMISLGRIEGVTEETRKNVVRSIPKSHGEPLEVARTFALWVAWKRGNEDPPAWAHPDAVLPNKEGAAPKKLSARVLKQMQRQEAIEAWKVAGPDRQSARQQAKTAEAISTEASSPAPSAPPGSLHPGSSSQYMSTPKTSVLGPKRIACDACRRRRIKCKHKDVVTTTNAPTGSSMLPNSHSFESVMSDWSTPQQQLPSGFFAAAHEHEQPRMMATLAQQLYESAPSAQFATPEGPGPALVSGSAMLADPNSKRGRSKACYECRKSKRRCVHDEYGKLDPIKAEQTPVTRGPTTKKRKSSGDADTPPVKKKSKGPQHQSGLVPQYDPQFSTSYPFGAEYQPSMVAPAPYDTPSYPEPSMSHWQQMSYMYPDPGHNHEIDANNGYYHQNVDPALQNGADNGGPYQQPGDARYSLPSLEQLANDVLESGYVNYPEEAGQSYEILPSLHPPWPEMQSQQFQQRPSTPPLAANTSTLAGKNESVDSAVFLPESVSPKGKKEFSQLHAGPRVSDDASRATSQDVEAAGDPTSGAATTGPASSHVGEKASNGPDAVPPSHISGELVNGDSHVITAPAVEADQGREPSPPSSPLTEPAQSPEAVKAMPEIPFYVPPERQSSRHSKPVERFNTNTYEPMPEPGRRVSKTPAPVPTAATTPRKRKRESVSMTPAPGAESTTNKSQASAMPSSLDRVAGEKELVSEPEDESGSLRLARALQGQIFGLRRR